MKERTSLSLKLGAVIRIGLITLPILVALLFTTTTENCNLIKTLLSQIIIFILFLTWVWKQLADREITVVKSPLNLPILIFIFMTLLSTLFFPYKYSALAQLSKFVSYGLLYFLMINTIKDKRDFNQFLVTLIAIAIVVSLYGLFQRCGLDFVGWDSQTRVLSSFGNPNFFAGYLVLFLPLMIEPFPISPKT